MPTFSVDTLLAQARADGGFAKQNRFMINLPNLAFGTLIPGTNRTSAFFDRTEAHAANIFSIYCRATNMPGKQILSVDRRVGLTYNKIAYGYASEDVGLSFQLTENYFIKSYFEAWQQSAVVSNSPGAHFPKFRDEYVQDVSIFQLGMDGKVKHKIKLLKAYPTTVNAIQFNDASGEPTELSVQLSYKRWIEE